MNGGQQEISHWFRVLLCHMRSAVSLSLKHMCRRNERTESRRQTHLRGGPDAGEVG